MTLRRLAYAAAALLCAGVLLIVATGADPLCDGWRCRQINDFRADHDRHGLDQRDRLDAAAKTYADSLAGSGVLAHDETWLRRHTDVSEVVGQADRWAVILRLWKQSPPHRAILLDRAATRVGIGCARDLTGTLYCVVRVR